MRMKLILLAMIMAVIAQPCIAGTILEADMIVTKDGRVFSGLSVAGGAESSHAEAGGDYRLEVKDAAGSVMWARDYDLKFITLTDPPADTDYEIITEKIPYDSRMYEIAFMKGDDILMQRWLDFCDGNGICDAKENAVSCASDCTAADKDRVCIAEADGMCDPDCIGEKDQDCIAVKQKEKAKKALIAVLMAAVLAAYVVVCVKIRKVHAACSRLLGKARGFWERKKAILLERTKPKGRKRRK